MNSLFFHYNDHLLYHDKLLNIFMYLIEMILFIIIYIFTKEKDCTND